MKTTPKEEQIGVRLLANFSVLTGVVENVTSPDQTTNWEALRETCVKFLDSGKDGIVQDMKELESIATRKVAENNE
ncbi:MAG TPA: hypothetical protein H9792_01335 [Candidatus Limosilactobacillus excrementigallinarum]|nr:hypothetical protein [Candidatus Limosilactobacillus excrementigallinarum]